MPKNWSLGKQFVPRRTCEICKGKFYAPPVLIRRGGGRFCSTSCRGKNDSIVYRSKQALNCTCLTCGKSFYKPKCHVEDGRGKFCSKKCIKRRRSLKQMLFKFGQKHIPENANCESCGKEFIVKAANRGKLCSWDCWRRVMTRYLRPSRHPRGKCGKRGDLNNQYFRSRWEANYARYLNWLKSLGEIERWEYEPDTFEFVGIKRGTRFYTPDFKVYSKDGTFCYHEIKGWNHPASKTKLKRMEKYHPGTKIILIEGKAYTAIARSVRNFIPEWEWDREHSN